MRKPTARHLTILAFFLLAGCHDPDEAPADASTRDDTGSLVPDGATPDGATPDDASAIDASEVVPDASEMAIDMATIDASEDAAVVLDASEDAEVTVDAEVALDAEPDAAIDAGPPPLPRNYFLPDVVDDARFLEAWTAHTADRSSPTRAELFFAGDADLDVTLDPAWPGTWAVLKHHCEYGGTLLLDTSSADDILGVSFPADDSAEAGESQTIFARLSTEDSIASLGARAFVCCNSETEACEGARDATWSLVGPIGRGVNETAPVVDAPPLAPLNYQVDGVLGEHRISINLETSVLDAYVLPPTMEMATEPTLTILGNDARGAAVRAAYPGALASPFVAAFDLNVAEAGAASEGEGVSFFWGELTSAAPAFFGEGWQRDEPDETVTTPAPHPWLGELELQNGRVVGGGFAVHFAPGSRQSVTLYAPSGRMLASAFVDVDAFDYTMPVVVNVLTDEVRVWVGEELLIDVLVSTGDVAGTEWGFSAAAITGATGYSIERVRARSGLGDTSAPIVDDRADVTLANWTSWFPGVFYDGDQATTLATMDALQMAYAQAQVCARRVRDRQMYIDFGTLRNAVAGVFVRGDGLVGVPIERLTAMWEVARDTQTSMEAFDTLAKTEMCENVWTGTSFPDDRYATRETPSPGKAFGPDVSTSIGQRNWLNNAVAEILSTRREAVGELMSTVAFGDFDGSMLTSTEIETYLLPFLSAIFTEQVPNDNLRRLRLALVIERLATRIADVTSLAPDSALATHNVTRLRQIRRLVAPLLVRLRGGETSLPDGEDAAVDFEHVFEAYLLLRELEPPT